jgi:hypothetical protein
VTNARSAAELLYESEATLRMVDHALDELGLCEDYPEPRSTRSMTVGPLPEPSPTGSDVPRQLALRELWELQELIEQVGRSRESLEQLGIAGGGSPEIANARQLLGEAEAWLNRLSRIAGG